ncbi:MAG TPA: VOC family protein [Pyrinomonadaceae bacterium]|nr:VOC family protein [Pyrinomonadaceae bacterium]
MKFANIFTLPPLAVALAVLGFSAVLMAHSTEEKKPMINRSTPILHVKNVEPSLKFWTERFGFKVTIQVPEDDHIGFAAMEAGNIELMLQTYQGMKGDPNSPLAKAADQGPSFIFMEVPDINAVIEALRGAEIVQGLHETPYGAKEVVVKEPGGHFVIFSQLPPH